MNRNDIREEYFRWLYDIVCANRHVDGISYEKVLRQMHDTEFTYLIARDENRAESGMELRYRFAVESGYKYCADKIQADLEAPCSILEMMVALAISCEEALMEDADYGNRTSQWFWTMMLSLGLSQYRDSRYDRRIVDGILTRFLNREYASNGKGGLFTVRDCDEDMRSLEIWAQMCRYLDSIM